MQAYYFSHQREVNTCSRDKPPMEFRACVPTHVAVSDQILFVRKDVISLILVALTVKFFYC